MYSNLFKIPVVCLFSAMLYVRQERTFITARPPPAAGAPLTYTPAGRVTVLPSVTVSAGQSTVWTVSIIFAL